MNIASSKPACAPICLFVYKRLEETQKTIRALQQNWLAGSSDLVIFSDAAKGHKDEEAVTAVREYIKDVNGFRSVRVVCRSVNLGLASSIISGVSELIVEHKRVIVLEDDLITSRNFLDFMNAALEYYEDRKSSFAVSGFSYPSPGDKSPAGYDVDFARRSYSWGWGTWVDRWNMVDWNVADYESFRGSRDQRVAFGKGGSDLPVMLDRQMRGAINSWMIRWVYAQFKLGKLDVHPVVSKVQNIGFGAGATHTAGAGRRYGTKLDDGRCRSFHFNPDINMHPATDKRLQWLHSPLRRAVYLIAKKLGVS